MEINKLVYDRGWNISPKGFSLITENETVKDLNSILRKALESDLKEIGNAVLSNELKKDKIDKLVLQVQKIRNISAPKANQESQAAPRMLRVILTDGHTTCQAVELTEIPHLSGRSTPPGTKLQLQGAKIISGCIILERNNCNVLGGVVPSLYEKWELTKNVNIERRSSTVDGAPPWVNFGEKIISSESNEEFKSLASKTSKEASKEFDEQRQGAIAELSTGAVRKVFGGGIRGSNILNKKEQVGYNNMRDPKREVRGREFERENKGVRGRKEREIKDKGEKVQAKPPEKVSLFDFLENKLPINEKDTNSNINTTTNANGVSLGTEANNYLNQQNRNYLPKFSTNQRPPRFQQQQRQSNYNSFENRNQTKPQNPKIDNRRNSPSKERLPYKVEQEWYRRDKVQQDKPVPKILQDKPVHQNSSAQSGEVSSQGDRKVSRDGNDVTAKMEKMSLNSQSLNSQYATRTLKQHLNLVAQGSNSFSRNNQKQGNWNWRIGDSCMAKYWEDKQYYNATIINLTDRTCVVQFNGYGNIEEVLKSDCIPLTDVQHEAHLYNNHPSSHGVTGIQKNQSSQSIYNRRT